MKALATCLGLLALCISACASSHSDSNSNTNWLRQCTGSSDCSGDYVCACGVCTVACSNDERCGMSGGPKASCIDVEASACAGGAVRTGSVCAAECQRDRDCTGDLSCVEGGCLLLQTLNPRDGGAVERDDGGGAATGGGRPVGMSNATDSGAPDSGSLPPGEGCGGVQCANGSECWQGACLRLWSGIGCEAAPESRPACTTSAQCAQGQHCHVDGTCIEAGKCDRFGRSTLASGNFRDLALSANEVFALDYGSEDSLGNHQGDGAVLRVPMAGGSAQNVVDGLVRPWGLDVDPERVIWSESPGTRTELWATGLAVGSTPKLLVANEVRGVAVSGWVHDRANVYLVSADPQIASPVQEDLDLFRVDKGTGGITLLSDGWTYLDGMAVDGSYVYVSTIDGLLPIPVAGGAPEQPFGVDFIFHVSRDYVLSSDYRDGTVTAIAKGDRSQQQIVDIGRENLHAAALQVHREHVYYLVSGDSNVEEELWRAPLEPGTAERLAVARRGELRTPFAVSDRGVFWIDEQRLLRQVIEDYASGVSPAQGAAGGPCHGDLSCDGQLACVYFECE